MGQLPGSVGCQSFSNDAPRDLGVEWVLLSHEVLCHRTWYHTSRVLSRKHCSARVLSSQCLFQLAPGEFFSNIKKCVRVKSDTLNFLEWEKKKRKFRAIGIWLQSNAFKTTHSAHSAMSEATITPKIAIQEFSEKQLWQKLWKNALKNDSFWELAYLLIMPLDPVHFSFCFLGAFMLTAKTWHKTNGDAENW